MDKKFQSIFLSNFAQQFLVIYETKNMNKASKLLNISQPALSINLRKAEEKFGFKLFTRSKLGLSSTSLGDIVYDYVKSLMNSSKIFEDEIHSFLNRRKKRLKIGLGVVWTTTLLPKVMRQLRKEFPGYNFDIITGVADDIGEKLKNGDVDVMISAEAKALGSDHTIKKTFLKQIRYSAICGSQNTMFNENEISLEAITKAEVAAFSNDKFGGEYLEEYFSRFNLKPPTIVTTTNSAAALLAILQSTNHIAFVLEPLAKRATELGLKQLKTDQKFSDLSIFIYFQSSAEDLPVISKFKDFVAKVFNENF